MEKTEVVVAENLRQVHVKLLDDLGKLEETVRPGATPGLADIRVRLNQTRSHINDHFDYEERGGYMDAVKAREPRLDGAIRQLMDEHEQFRQSLNALITRISVAKTLEPKLRDDIRFWIESLRRHESRENELVQEAFNQDLSAGD